MFIIKISRFLEKLATKNIVIMNVLSLYYRDLVRKEVKLAKLDENDKILCIGGGKCPFTAILIQKYTGAEVTVVDNCQSCVNSAKNCIMKYKIKNIKVDIADGEYIDASNYTAIHLAMQVCPMQEVMENVIKKSNKDAKILVRKPKKALGAMYSSIKCTNDLLKQEVRHNVFVNSGYTSLYHKAL